MGIPTAFNIATTTVIGIFLASVADELDNVVLRKIKHWILNHPYKRKLRCTCRRRGVFPPRSRASNSPWGAFQKIICGYKNSVERITDFVDWIRNPYADLCIDEVERGALNAIIDCCEYFRPVPFWIAVPFWKQVYMSKMAEGAYGEVYITINISQEYCIYKFVPVNGENPNKERRNVYFDEIATDVMCSKYLPKLNKGKLNRAPNFPELHSLNLVRGEFPSMLTKAWETYESQIERSQNDSKANLKPDFYTKNQFFIVTELQHCGNTLFSQSELDITIYLSCISQIVSALAVAEEAFQFEHRDLHINNILIQVTDQPYLEYAIHGETFKIDTCGVQAYIIDYNLSRITVNHHTFSTRIYKDPNFVDSMLADSHPRGWLLHSPVYHLEASICNFDWSSFNPITNIYWLKYLIENIWFFIGESIETRDISPREHDALYILRSWGNVLLEYHSARNFLIEHLFHTCPLITRKNNVRVSIS